MKCICFSDSHGSTSYMTRALAAHPDAEVVFFLGDGLDDVASVAAYDRKRAWLFVRGNCDRRSTMLEREVKKTEAITLMGKKIVYTHGDLYGAKYGSDGLIMLAERTDADIVLFGHTHSPLEKYISKDRGIYLFNPGSIGYSYVNNPSYGIMTLTDSGVLFSHGSFV